MQQRRDGSRVRGTRIRANATGVFIYATNFRCGTVDVFDETFKPATLRGSFHDPDIPDRFGPVLESQISGGICS